MWAFQASCPGDDGLNEVTHFIWRQPTNEKPERRSRDLSGPIGSQFCSWHREKYTYNLRIYLQWNIHEVPTDELNSKLENVNKYVFFRSCYTFSRHSFLCPLNLKTFCWRPPGRCKARRPVWLEMDGDRELLILIPSPLFLLATREQDSAPRLEISNNLNWICHREVSIWKCDTERQFSLQS